MTKEERYRILAWVFDNSQQHNDVPDSNAPDLGYPICIFGDMPYVDSLALAAFIKTLPID